MFDQIVEINKDALAEELGIENITDEEKADLYDLFEKNIEAKLTLYLESACSQEELEEVKKLDLDGLDKFLATKEIDLKVLLIRYTLEVKEDLLKDVAFMKGYMAAKNDEAQDAA